jgi:hypothetical protein
VKVDTRWSFEGFPVLRLENDALTVDVLPDLGGKILQITHRPLGRSFLWHNPRQHLRRLPLGTSYDDHFFGGWDELLPNDIAEQIGGENLVDHGELWTTPLSASIEGRTVALSGLLPITPLRFEKRIALTGGESFELRYKLENIGRRRLDILFKLHPALRISQGAEIRVAASHATVGDPGFSRFTGSFDWPGDAGVVPELNGTCEFLYLTGLARGACGLAHRGEDWRFDLTFDPKVFQSVWLFASFGGWRELETLVLEPCTTWPMSLAEAAVAGQCLRLDAGERLETKVDCHVGTYM